MTLVLPTRRVVTVGGDGRRSSVPISVVPSSDRGDLAIATSITVVLRKPEAVRTSSPTSPAPRPR